VALQRSAWLRRAGVRTPAGHPGENAREVAFDHIAGANRFDLLAAVPMADLLAPLCALHDVPPVTLPRFEPLSRIRPRLAGGIPGWLTGALDRLCQDTACGTVLLHGDFHVGQLIRDGKGDIWLIDLDDLATGPQEADLGNFIAHLSTSAEAARGSFDEGLAFWRHAVLSAWRRLGRGCDPVRLDRFLRLALIRRHLKLRAAGRPDYADAIRRCVSAP
jgi:hypothetical protein